MLLVQRPRVVSHGSGASMAPFPEDQALPQGHSVLAFVSGLRVLLSTLPPHCPPSLPRLLGALTRRITEDVHGMPELSMTALPDLWG